MRDARKKSMPKDREPALPADDARLHVDDRIGERHFRQAGEQRKQGLVEPRVRPLHDEVGKAEQAARSQRDFARCRPIHERHTESECHAERDDQHREQRTAGGMAQWVR